MMLLTKNPGDGSLMVVGVGGVQLHVWVMRQGGRAGPGSGASHPFATHSCGGMELMRNATAGGLNQADDRAARRRGS
jgi:hypothetical protein